MGGRLPSESVAAFASDYARPFQKRIILRHTLSPSGLLSKQLKVAAAQRISLIRRPSALTLGEICGLGSTGDFNAAICGGRARCTTCRVLVTRGFASPPAPEPLEASALARIAATPGIRLARQIRPRKDIAVAPLLAADPTAHDGRMPGGLEGRERLVNVAFVDLRGSTRLAEGRLPYDVLFILNQFIREMGKAPQATGGHYSQFTGDGLMALYGLDAADPTTGAAAALRGASEMLTRLEQLNRRIEGEWSEPLRIGIGIHYSEAIVGAMGNRHRYWRHGEHRRAIRKPYQGA